MNLHKFFFLPFILIVHSACASDFELWANINTSYTLSPCWGLNGIVEARFRDDASKAYLYYVEVNLIRTLSQGWLLVPGYRQVYRRTDLNRWKFESIPHASIFKEMQVCCYDFEFRNRIEYRSLDNVWVFRERLLCSLPKRWTFLNFRPSSFGEVFFRTGVGFSQYRIFGGFIGDYLTIGYLYRKHRPSGIWRTNNVLFISGQWNF